MTSFSKLIAAVAMTVAATCAMAQSDASYVKEKGVLTIGITEFAPMDFKNEKGEWVGFDADTAKAFCASLGVKCDFQLIDWDSKVLELRSKNIDAVWNGMTLTDEVKSSMATSKAYCNNAQIVVLPANIAQKYPTAASLKGLTFAVEAGSAGKAEADANKFKSTEVTDQATAILEVSSGNADAAIIDSLMAAAMVGPGTSYDKLTYTVKLNSEEYGVGFRKGSDLVPLLNNFFKKSYKDGTLKAIAERYKVQAALIPQD